MTVSKELNRIKKKYGEDFMKLCRDLFPTILEQEGRLEKILDDTFADNTITLCEDIVSNGLEEKFKNFIYNKIDVEESEYGVVTEKTPYELLDEVGYVLTECLTEEEIQRFKKYYKPGEELCTFHGERLNKCVVFFAVKKDANEIKRENFKNPKREDEYGTSVMGIQFTKNGLCTVSIKNRYNHTVNNPDATYGNNLDRIIPGLERSFKNLLYKEYGLNLNYANIEEFEIPKYVVANNGKYYKYNMELDTVYYCPGNVIIENGEVAELENPESQILMDYFILDMKNKTIKLYDESIEDSFIDGLQDLQDAQITVQKTKKKTKIITIQKPDKDPIIIELNSDNQIIGYENYGLEHVGKKFLIASTALINLNLPNLRQVGDRFLYHIKNLVDLNLPNLKQAGNEFLNRNRILNSLNLPNLEQVGDDFLKNNEELASINLPKLKQVGNSFLAWNEILTNLDLPNLERVGDFFLYNNKIIDNLNLPSLKQVGNEFLGSNKALTSLNLLNLEQAGDFFLEHNEKLANINLPNLKRVGNTFLVWNEMLTNLDLPNLEQVGDSFLETNEELTDVNLSSLKKVGNSFLYRNRTLTNLELPNLEQVEDYFYIIIIN